MRRRCASASSALRVLPTAPPLARRTIPSRPSASKHTSPRPQSTHVESGGSASWNSAIRLNAPVASQASAAPAPPKRYAAGSIASAPSASSGSSAPSNSQKNVAASALSSSRLAAPTNRSLIRPAADSRPASRLAPAATPSAMNRWDVSARPSSSSAVWPAQTSSAALARNNQRSQNRAWSRRWAGERLDTNTLFAVSVQVDRN